MSPFDPDTWSVWTWALDFLAVYFLAGFFVYLRRFRRLERAAAAGDPDRIAAYNDSLRGWPRSGYAKMTGRTPLVAQPAIEAGAEDAAPPEDRP